MVAVVEGSHADLMSALRKFLSRTQVPGRWSETKLRSTTVILFYAQRAMLLASQHDAMSDAFQHVA